MPHQTETQQLALVGCGAISELYYAPALKEAAKLAGIEVSSLCDPSPARLNALRASFPAAQVVATIEDLIALKPDLAIVASPPRFHAVQSNALLASGAHVLCEKPMASSVAEAESMITAASLAKRVLAIGLFRRFFPALQAIEALLSSGVLGAPKAFVFSEGGPFNWPAVSASFFQSQHSQGGVLLDLGAHVLDLVCWWFGDPVSFSYEDDAMGNLEANCRLALSFAGGLNGEVRLSRDTTIDNHYQIEFERGHLLWAVGDANHMDVRLNGLPFHLHSELYENSSPAATYHQSFVKQLLNFAAAARGAEPVLVPGEEGIRSLRLIEQCYGTRQLMAMPWFSESESQRARELAVG
jgi:predicted dehydrogenase